MNGRIGPLLPHDDPRFQIDPRIDPYVPLVVKTVACRHDVAECLNVVRENVRQTVADLGAPVRLTANT